MPKRSKRLRAVLEQVDQDRLYDPAEAVALVKRTATAKFDETVELHLRTGLDGRHAEQQLRGSVTLPHGLGREMRVVVFAEGEAASIAIEAGADEVGGDELIRRVEQGFTDFNQLLEIWSVLKERQTQIADSLGIELAALELEGVTLSNHEKELLDKLNTARQAMETSDFAKLADLLAYDLSALAERESSIVELLSAKA